MNRAGTVGGHGLVRLFFGLPLPPPAGLTLARWAETALGGHEGVRLVSVPNIHVTLVFLGRRPATELSVLGEALRSAAGGLDRPVLRPRRYRETDRVAMVVLDDEGGRAARLQARLSRRLQRLGIYEPERRPWLAHATVARFGGARPRLYPDLPALDPISPSEAALYHSHLKPGGAEYAIVEAVALRG